MEKDRFGACTKGGGIWDLCPPPPPQRFGPELRISESLSEEERQTNNAADVVAVIAALRRFETTDCKICVFTDSEYVVLGGGGGGGAARKWQQNGWVGSRGPLTNVRLWVELLDVLSYMGDRVQWVQVPSHVGLEGNEVANDLAIDGMCRSPLWGVVHGRPAPPPVVGAVTEPEVRSPLESSFEGSDDESLCEFAVDLAERSSDGSWHNSGSKGSSGASDFAPARDHGLYVGLVGGYSEDTEPAPSLEVSDWEGHLRRKCATLLKK